MARYRIEHRTVYDYAGPVVLAQQRVRLLPRTLPWQRCLQFSLQSDPPWQSAQLEYDYFGNGMHSLFYGGSWQQLSLVTSSEVELGERPWHGCALPDSPPWEQVRAAVRQPQHARQAEFCFASPLVPLQADIADFARPYFSAGRPLLAAVQALMQAVHEQFAYQPGHTDSNSSVEQVWRSRRGVCQDFAHLMLCALRGVGLAARYMSGYLRTEPPPGQPRLVGSDATHAWIAVWCPPLGWVEFDPTNNQLAGTDYIVLGWGRDYGDISPVRGVITGAAGHRLQVQVTVWPEPEYPAAAG